MAFALRQSTASQEVPLGPFLDTADANTEETAITLSASEILVWKTGATALVAKNSGDATHMQNGIFYAVLDATDTNTAGPLVIFARDTAALWVRLECVVYPAHIYDLMFTDGTGVELALKKLTIANSAGSALVLSSTGGNGNGLQASGHGTGAGIRGKGGATGEGIEGEGGSTSGNGFHGHGPTSGSGMYLLGTGDGDGITAVGAAGSGMGAHFIAGAGSNLHGAGFTGDGSGDGIRANGTGASGGCGIRAAGASGISATGEVGAAIYGYGETNGIEVQGENGFGIQVYGETGGAEVSGLGTGAFGLGVYSVDNGDGMYAEGHGTGKDINAAEIDNIRARLSTLATETGAVVTDGSNTSLTFKTNLTEDTDDHYKDCLIKMTSGALSGQVKKCSAYNGTTKFISVTGGFTGTPANTDTFEIIND